MAYAPSTDSGLAAALTRRPTDLALACRAELEALEARGDVRDADRALRELAVAFAAVAGPPRTTCTAPNCAGHRIRA